MCDSSALLVKSDGAMLRQEIKWRWQRVKNLFHFLKSWYWVVKCGFPARKMTIVGVTGTDGKTTTCTLIYEMLKKAGFEVALVSTVSAKIGSEEIDTGFHTTNPDASVLQPLLLKMVKRGVTHLVLEVTAHGLDQFRVAGCNFEVAVLTNISHEHLDDFVDMGRYKRAKLKLFLGARYALLNVQDESYEYFKKEISRRSSGTRIIGYKEAWVRGVPKCLAGGYNRQNIGAAMKAAEILGVRRSIAIEAVRNFGGVLGRREEVVAGQNFRVVVDFAHTPNALEKVMEQLRKELPAGGRLIAVFGATGERDETKRPMMGKVASRFADAIIITSDDTRRESQEKIFGQIFLGVEDKSKVIKENDRRRAIEMAVAMAKKGDIVLLAGKGHERSLLIGKTEYAWSDVDEAKRAIRSLGQ